MWDLRHGWKNSLIKHSIVADGECMQEGDRNCTGGQVPLRNCYVESVEQRKNLGGTRRARQLKYRLNVGSRVFRVSWFMQGKRLSHAFSGVLSVVSVIRLCWWRVSAFLVQVR